MSDAGDFALLEQVVTRQAYMFSAFVPAFIDTGRVHTCVLHVCGMLFGVNISIFYASGICCYVCQHVFTK